MNKQQLKGLMAKDAIRMVIDIMLEITPNIDNSLHDDTVQLAARFAAYQRDMNARTVSQENLDLAINNVRSALGQLIGQLPEGEFAVSASVLASVKNIENGMPEPSIGTITPDKQVLEQKHDSRQYPGSNLSWIIGLGLLLLGVGFLAVKSCPTQAQFFGIRLLLALGAGGLATMLPGMLNIHRAGVSAGGALGMAALIYLINPAKLIVSDSCMNQPFDFTVSVQIDKSLRVPPTYPGIANSVLRLRLGNEWKSDTLDIHGDADFKNIAGDYKGRKAAVQLAARYWTLHSDSVLLEGKSQIVLARPDGSLGKIRGKVVDGTIGAPVPDATIEVLGITTNSNNTGNFELDIPLEKQLTSDYEVNAYKEGFLPWKGNATPATGALLNIILLKHKK